MEHTKGEWILSAGCFARQVKTYVTNTDLEVIAGVEANTEKEVLANAHLIAAAPDMYEALKGLMRDYSTNPNSDIFYAACLKAREALTKAEGKGE